MKRKKMILGALLFIILLAVGLASFFFYRNLINNKGTIKRQAVFLTNGQVYFGYISHETNQIVVLKDIYYLKTDDLLAGDSQDKKKVSIIKLGSELHGPENIMYLNRDQILFYENMRDDSKINDAIAKFSSNDKK